jgi:hypothetical protein
VIRLAAVAALAITVLLLPISGPVGGSGPVAAASPEATRGPGGGGGDPRSVGEGPGLVGNPLFAIVLVIGIGAVAAGLTALYVRATGGRRTGPPTRRVR